MLVKVPSEGHLEAVDYKQTDFYNLSKKQADKLGIEVIKLTSVDALTQVQTESLAKKSQFCLELEYTNAASKRDALMLITYDVY